MGAVSIFPHIEMNMPKHTLECTCELFRNLGKILMGPVECSASTAMHLDGHALVAVTGNNAPLFALRQPANAPPDTVPFLQSPVSATKQEKEPLPQLKTSVFSKGLAASARGPPWRVVATKQAFRECKANNVNYDFKTTSTGQEY
eukprot:1161034-Pelagomonas_calceolata.AAC.3